MQEIEYLDFRSLTVEQCKLYNEVVPDLQETFNQIIGSIYEKNRNNHNWYFSTVASRSPHQSPLFERLCKVRLLEIILSQNDFLEVILDDYCLYKYISKYFSNNSLKINFVGRKKSYVNICINLTCRYVKYVSIILCKWALASFHKINLLRDKDLFLIDTFIYSGDDGQGTINNGVYNDRYFPNFIEHARNEIDSEILYVPTLLIDKGFLPSYLKLLKQKNFLAKEPYLKIVDWVNLIVLPFRKVDLKDINLKFQNYNVLELIKDELLFNKFSVSKLISGINYSFIRRLNFRKIFIKGFIEWYENQVIDRGMILGLRKYFTDVKICGYQGFVVCPIYNFYLVPTKYERDHLLTPHIVAVTGQCLKENVSKYYDVKTIVAPAFRFQHLHRNRTKFPDESKFTILMPFSICLKTSFANLDLLLRAVKKSSICTNQTEIIVKMHPAFSTEEIKRQIKRFDQQIQISDEDFNLVLQKANILVGSTTSACVEALVFNVSILIVANYAGITSNPIPYKYMDQCKIVYDSDDLAEHISLASMNSPQSLVAKTKILEDCFQEVNQKSVEAFLSELKK